MADSGNTSRDTACSPFASQRTTRFIRRRQLLYISIHNDMIGVVDQGDIGALVLLDLSVAFDTVDHSILIDVYSDDSLESTAVL